MSEHWVPTGREFDEGANSPLHPKKQRTKRFIEKVLGKSRRAHDELAVRPGVGEARAVLDARPTAAPNSTALPPGVAEAKASSSASAQSPQLPKPPASAARSEQGHSGPRRRRQTTIRPGVAPEIGARPEDVGGRVGSWPADLTEQELRRNIGPTQHYGDST
jgi:hypothetical protein